MGGYAMSGHAQFLEDCPDYRWNPKTEMFEAHLYATGADGVREYTTSYSIRPEVYRAIITEMIAAQQDYYQWRERPDNVVGLRPGGH